MPIQQFLHPGDCRKGSTPFLFSFIHTIFFHANRKLIRRRVVWTQSRLTDNHDNISPFAIAVQIKGNARVSRDMRQAFRIGATINEEGRAGLIPF